MIEMVSIERADFDGDSNLGLHAEVTDNFCIIDPSLSEKCYGEVEDALDVETIKATVAGSRMVGIFCAANSEGVVLPRNVEENEKKIFSEEGLNTRVIDTKQTALGNLILVNDNFCIASERLEDVKEELSDCFQVPVKTASIADLDIVGSSGSVTNNGLLCHRDATEEEMEVLEDSFDMECGRGTVNFGVPFVGASLLANSHGVLTGEETSGPELGRIQEALLPEDG